MIDIDELSALLSKNLQKANLKHRLGVPPMLAYRLRTWLRQMKNYYKYRALWGLKYRPSAMFRSELSNLIADTIKKHVNSKLQKNEIRATVFSDGLLKLDFGKEISDVVKNRVLRWAKRRKLNIVEASLKKSSLHDSYLLICLVDKIIDSTHQTLKIKRYFIA